MKKSSALPLSAEACAQLLELRTQGQSFEVIASQIPCSSGTVWRAAQGGTLARATRLLMEARLRELTAPTSKEAAV